MYILEANAIIVSKFAMRWLIRSHINLLLGPFWYQQTPISMFDGRSIDSIRSLAISLYSLIWDFFDILRQLQI
jgi:hypothetical protein